MKKELTVALIGLDTSHTVAFAELVHGEVPPEKRVSGLRMSRCLRFPSAFQSESDQDKRQARLEALGIGVTRSLEEAARDADAFMLEINDPALHLPYFERVAPFRKPVFVDKPLADTLENARKIAALADCCGIMLWSSSALRFVPEIARAKASVPAPLACHVHGPLGGAPRGSDVVWYGVHAVEMLVALMGPGARTVRARPDAAGTVIIVQYGDGRRGLVELNLHGYQYGGCVQSKDDCHHFVVQGESAYHALMVTVRDAFHSGRTPVSPEETLEVQAILNAADRCGALRGDEEAPVADALCGGRRT